MLAYYQKEDLRLSKEIEGKNSQQTQRDQPSVQMTGRNETVDYSKLNLLSWASSMNQIVFWELKMSQWMSQAPSPFFWSNHCNGKTVTWGATNLCSNISIKKDGELVWYTRTKGRVGDWGGHFYLKWSKKNFTEKVAFEFYPGAERKPHTSSVGPVGIVCNTHRKSIPDDRRADEQALQCLKTGRRLWGRGFGKPKRGTSFHVKTWILLYKIQGEIWFTLWDVSHCCGENERG